MVEDVWLKSRMRAGNDRTADSAAASETRIALAVCTLKTPIGILRVAASADSVLSIELPRRRAEPALERWLRSHVPHAAESPVLHDALSQLRE